MTHAVFSFALRLMSFVALGLVFARSAFSADAPPPLYTFTTLAGSPGGSGGADGPADRAQFFVPRAVAMDAVGNIYVAEESNRAIRKITPAGVVSTFAGIPGLLESSVDGTGSAARFFALSGITVDGLGNVYVSDAYSIRKITPAGVVTTLAGSLLSPGSTNGVGTAARFRKPSGLIMDATGNLFVADTENHVLRRITPAGEVTTVAGSAGASGFADGTGADARFSFPAGLGIDVSGNLYVSEMGNHTIRKVTPAGVVSTLAGSPGNAGEADGTGTAARFRLPLGLTVDEAGNVYVADTNNHTIRRITPTGVVTSLAGDSQAFFGYVDAQGAAARFNSPRGITRDGSGNLVVADASNHLIRRVNVTGLVTTLAGRFGGPGSDDGIGDDARFNRPEDLVADDSGGVFVVDSSNHTIRRIAPGGEVSTFAGAAGIFGSANGTGAAARFGNPSGIARDPGGNLFVADTGNHTIRRITPAGAVSTFAGTAGEIGSTDGAGPAARFFGPTRLAFDGSGNLYVADAGNFTLRRITPSGTVTTVAGTAGQSGLADAIGPAARFGTLAGLAVDATGRVFIADTTNRTLRMFTSSTNQVVTMAGDFPNFGDADGAGADARFRAPTGLARDGSGTLFLADRLGQTIRRITIGDVGTVTTIGGLGQIRGNADGAGGTARFYSPRGVAMDSAGNLYVADSFNNTIRWGNTAVPARTSAPTANAIVGQPFAYTTTFSGVVGGSYTAAGLPPGLNFNANTGRISGTPTVPGTFAITLGATNGAGTGTGTLTVAITGGNAADEAYAFTNLAGTAGVDGSTNGTGVAARFWNPSGVAVAAGGNVFVADSSNRVIRRISAGGVVTTFAGSAGQSGSTNGTGAAARFQIPHAIAIDRTGNLYVTDYGSHTIRRITPAGAVTTIAGTPGSEGSADGNSAAARFRYPEGIAVDAAGVVYVADTENHTIRRISLTGEVITFAGTAGSAGPTDGTRSAARFNFPSGIAVDTAGNLYIADGGNHTIRKITPSGVVTTLAGTAGSLGSTDGTGTTARFRQPKAIAVDAAGNLYVGDALNHLIRKVTAAGVVTTLGGAAGLPGATNGRGAAALFREPHGIAVDVAGNLYVADYENHTVRWGALDTPTLASSPVATGAVGQRFSYAARFSGTLVGPYTAASLPTGLTINATTGLISGVPATAGTFAVTLNATNGAGTRGSTLALTISAAPPVLTAQPASVAVSVGGPATFTVRAGGSPPLSYQWNRNGVPIAGATQASLTLRTTAADAGQYTVTVSNGLGQVTSAAGVLTVNPLSALSNLSVRTTLAGGQTLIVGAVVTGGSKELLFRAAGPALNTFGLAGQADPRLELFTTGVLPTAVNEDWSDGLASVFTSLGAFPFTPGSRDAALSETLDGAFTVQARGPAAGTVLVEAYDMAGGVAPRLINLSARNQVGIGDNVLIAGFAVSGTGRKQLLIRAVGPALTGFGVTGALTDPRLQVFSSAGTVIATNDNWESGLAAAFTQVGAFPLTAGSRDAALLATLDAGASYTVQVDGIGGTTGEALIEIYEVF